MGVVEMDMLWEMELDSLHINFQDSGNPLFIWGAFRLCREQGQEIPDWVFEYFENVASNLIALSEREEMSSDRASAEVYEALGMKKLSPRDIFERFSLYKRNQDIVSKICYLIETEKAKITHALTTVSEEKGLEFGTVRKIFYDWLNDGEFTREKAKRYNLPESL